MEKNYSFTVKVVHTDGATRLWATDQVSAYRAGYVSGPPGTAPIARDMVVFDLHDGTEASLDRGTVYVMNANGKTVDTFHLDGIYGHSA